MRDEQAPQEPVAADEVRGPLVAPGLVPSIERPAHPGPAPLWQSAGVALLVLAVLSAIAAGLVSANDRWGDAAQLAIAGDAFQALVSGNADTFLALVEPGVRAGVKRADILANADLGRDLQWIGPRFADGAVVLTVRSRAQPGDTGTATFTPDPRRGDLVLMMASGGPFGEASGTIQLTRTPDGWRITGYRFAGFVEPTATPVAR